MGTHLCQTSTFVAATFNAIRDGGVKRWCVGGDFNAIAGASERRSTSRLQVHPDRGFVDWLTGSGMEEIHFQGPEFTWTRKGSVSRIDRAVANHGWVEKLNGVSLIYSPRYKFDHCPLLLRNAQGQQRGDYFRFFAPCVIAVRRN
ncbi:hypothetical protein K1719_032574 [Acacia pycnantha]|nr:hypothetical protein K1719_038998 [Acacia pycnantha]KAI9085507.1 hypothetical protein K1719_032574 [Acacia pycnantha]